MDNRQRLWDSVGHTRFDVAVIGGGVMGACLYDRLCRSGYRVLLVDQGDFGGGTSQASGMMIWGGLLYLRNLDFGAVFRFSRARDALLKDLGGWVTPAVYRYIPSGLGRSRHVVLSALYLYWFIGLLQRRRPIAQARFREATLIRPGTGRVALGFEEGLLRWSDTRFVLHWIAPHQSLEQVPLNYCSAEHGEYARRERVWRLHLKDTLRGAEAVAAAGCVVNCAGPWADTVNAHFGIQAPFKHVLSKGVYLGLRRRAGHESPLIFDMGAHGDVLTYVPWGPIALWGPTETAIARVEEGFSVSVQDARFLLEHAAGSLRDGLTKADVVSFKCGVRPLAVPRSFDADCYPLDLSRHHRIAVDRDVRWISLYGGKLTSCRTVADAIAARLPIERPGASPPATDRGDPEPIQTTNFPGMEGDVPTAAWCARNELCCTVADYLRRRTNIALWVAREGLGANDENLPALRRIALELNGQDETRAEREVRRYAEHVRDRFDRVLAGL